MKKKMFFGLIFLLAIFIIGLGILLYEGLLWFNNPSMSKYPVRGVDVSSYQGTIDWSKLSKQGISFAYIKATEGSSFHDDRFSYNWENAEKTNLRIGAYHFFSFDSSGITQARNFIKYVPRKKANLPPAVDIELYGSYQKTIPEKEKTDEILTELLRELEKCYGKKPVIYATTKTYNLYIKGEYKDYNIWFRDIFSTPQLHDNRNWKLWQYSNRQSLKGYSGKERFIDMNVFNGTKSEFNDF